jgi:hypothetical protein
MVSGSSFEDRERTEAMKKTVATTVTTVMGILLGVTLAGAQEYPFAPNGYVLGRSGVTFGTATAPLVGGEAGVSVGPLVKVYGSFDWHRDISPKAIGEFMDFFSDLSGVDMNVRMPAFTFVGGTRVQLHKGAVRPYGLGGFGYGRLNGTVEIEGDDVTDMADELGIIDRDDIQFNKPLFEVGGGVVVPMGRAFLDAGYRFRKFLDADEINVSGVFVGGGIGF